MPAESVVGAEGAVGTEGAVDADGPRLGQRLVWRCVHIRARGSGGRQDRRHRTCGRGRRGRDRRLRRNLVRSVLVIAGLAEAKRPAVVVVVVGKTAPGMEDVVVVEKTAPGMEDVVVMTGPEDVLVVLGLELLDMEPESILTGVGFAGGGGVTGGVADGLEAGVGSASENSFFSIAIR